MAFGPGKISNAVRLQQRVEREVRGRLGLSTQRAGHVPRQVAATYQGRWTKVRQQAQQRARGDTKKRYNGLDGAPQYVARTTTCSSG
jgi:hypothetical protein